MTQLNSFSLGEIAKLIGAKLVGNPHTLISGVGSLENAKSGQISFLVGTRYQLIASTRYRKLLPETQASAVILSPSHESLCPVDKLISPEPYLAFAKVAKLFVKPATSLPGIHPTAIVGENCHLHPSVSVGPYCVIEDHCQIDENTHIASHSVIKRGVKIGKYGEISSGVKIYEEVIIGERVVIHANAVIGKEGFGIIRAENGWQKIPHLGKVEIGDDVEIGANTTIDRGVLENTLLKNGVKLDNQIQVAHGVVIGENTVIAGCTGIGGSTKIGKNCMIGGAVGIADNLEICDNVIFTGMAQVVKSIRTPGIYSSGTGIKPQKIWQKSLAQLYDLENFVKKIKKSIKLEKLSDE